jgi:hypothetical protein
MGNRIDIRKKRFLSYYDRHHEKYIYLGSYDYCIWLSRDRDGANEYVPKNIFNVNYFPCKLVDSGEMHIDFF